MKKRTANLILVNSHNEVLLQLRDNIPTIPYPNTWCLPGGHIEGDESPEECLVREMREEMAIDLPNLTYFTEQEYSDETEYFFLARVDFDVRDVELTEGQAIKWFSYDTARQLPMAHNDGAVLQSFFAELNLRTIRTPTIPTNKSA